MAAGSRQALKEMSIGRHEEIPLPPGAVRSPSRSKIARTARMDVRRIDPMSVTLTPHAETRIRHLIESGQFPNAAAVIDRALEALDDE